MQGELATVEADAGAALTELQQRLDAAETSNPLVSAALTAAKGTVTALGLKLPTEAAIFAALKAAAADLGNALKTS